MSWGIRDVHMSNLSVVLCCVGLGEEVGEVRCTGLPFDAELALVDAVADPVEAHVDGFGALDVDCVCGKPDCTLVVARDGCG